MELRARVTNAMKQAMKDKDSARLSTLRLINAAIKDRDIAARGDGADTGVGDAEILTILDKMTKQRKESAKTYEEGGRLDLAERELAEITVIEEFLPRKLTDEEIASRRAAMEAKGDKAWKPAEVRPRKVSRALKVYAAHVGNASQGAVRLDP